MSLTEMKCKGRIERCYITPDFYIIQNSTKHRPCLQMNIPGDVVTLPYI